MGEGWKEPPPTWREALYNYSQDTTLHGVRLITADTAFAIRRLFWIVFVMCAMAGFMYIVYIQLAQYYLYKKTVNVEIIQTEKLTFPAITICNQNYFRRSKAFELGIYDALNTGFTKSSKQKGVCGPLAFNTYYGQYLHAPLLLLEVLHQVSLQVCRDVCIRSRGTTCNSVMYNKLNRTCYISSVSDDSGYEKGYSDVMVLAVRNTCDLTVEVVISSDFDSGDGPEYLTQQPARPGVNGSWLHQKGPTSTPRTGPLFDHTTSAGYYMYLEATGNAYMQAALRTSYLRIATEAAYCLRMYYSMVGEEEHLGTIKVRRRETTQLVKDLAVFNTGTREMWTMVMVPLSSGLFQVEIWGQVGTGSRGDMAIDDVQIAKCEAFKQDCMESVNGVEYMGYTATPSAGLVCARWDEALTPVEAEKQGLNFPEKNITLAVNYCRNPNRQTRPWCYVATATIGIYTKATCQLDYCPCSRRQFRCLSGQCISADFTCNIMPDCEDGSDEKPSTAGCSISVACNFDSDTMCGYIKKSNAPAECSWARHSRNMINTDVIFADAAGDQNGHYAYINSGSFSLQSGRRTWLISPLHYAAPGVEMCLTVSYYITVSEWIITELDEDQSKLDDLINDIPKINVYRQDAKCIRIPLWSIYPKMVESVLNEEASDSDEDWSTITIRVPQVEGSYKIVFEGVLSEPYESDMAIDSLRFDPCTAVANVTSCSGSYSMCDNGRCVLTTKFCDSKNDCFDNSDEYNCTGISMNCTFTESFLCGYTDDSDPKMDFWAYSSFYSSVAVEAWVLPGVVKRLVSPWTMVTVSSCLMIVVSLEGERCEMQVQRQMAKQTDMLARVKKQGENTYGFVVDPQTEQLRFVYSMSCQQPMWIAVQITAIDIYPGECILPQASGGLGSSSLCNFTGSENCDMTDISMSTEQSWTPSDLGMEATNIGDDTYGISSTAEMISPKIDAGDSHMCLSFTVNVTLPEVASWNGEVSVSQYVPPSPFPPPPGPPPAYWTLSLNTGFSGKVQGFFQLHKGMNQLHIKAALPFGAVIYLKYVEIAQGKCAPSCAADMFLCDGDSPTCLPSTVKCDSIVDCPEGQDEDGDLCQHTDVIVVSPGPESNSDSRGSSISTAGGTECTCQAPNKKVRRRRKRSTSTVKQCTNCPSSDQGDMALIGDKLSVQQKLWPKDIAENMTHVYYTVGHQSDSLIFDCEWQGIACNVSRFRTDILDYGLCHTFNIMKDYLETSETGSSNGLRVVLNIEGYEQMRGPQDDSGVKMFVFNQSEVPFVRDLGFAIGPGVHALVATTYTKAISLGQPWGNCSKDETYSECKRRCETKSTIAKCKCRDAYMNITVRDSNWGPSDMYIKTPVCGLYDYLYCISSDTGQAMVTSNATCDCDEPCIGGAYMPSLSYAALSSSTVDKLKAKGLAALKSKVNTALEAQQRTMPDKYIEDLDLLKNLITHITEYIEFIKSYVYSSKRSVLISVPKALNTLVNKYLYADLQTAMEHVADYKHHYEKKITSLEHATSDLLSRLRTDLYSFIQSFGNTAGFLDGDLESVYITMQSLETLLEDYEEIKRDPRTNGPQEIFGGTKNCAIEPLLRNAQDLAMKLYSLKDAPTSDTKRRKKREAPAPAPAPGAAAPAPAPGSSGPGSDGGSDSSSNSGPGSDPMSQQGQMDNGPCTTCASYFQDGIKETHEDFSKDASLMEVCLTHCSVMLHQVADWIKKENTTIALYTGMLAVLKKTETVTKKVDFFSDYNKIVRFNGKLKEAYEGYISGTKGPKEISAIFSVETIDDLRQEFTQFQSKLDSAVGVYEDLGVQNLNHVCTTYTDMIKHLLNLGKFYGKDKYLEKARSLKIWKSPVSSIEDPTNPSESDSLRIDSLDEFVKNQAKKIVYDIVVGYSASLTMGLVSLKDDVKTMGTKIISDMDMATAHYATFKKETTVDHDFVKRNFIVADIFFAQLKYMSIIQEEAYKIEDFFASVGGYMGLFIGASCLTIFEILDFLLYNCCLKISYRKKTSPVKDVEAGYSTGKEPLP